MEPNQTSFKEKSPSKEKGSDVTYSLEIWLEDEKMELEEKEEISKMVENLDPDLCFFASSNLKNRYFLTSKENFFGGIKVPYCMLDTGCSSYLLPMTKEDLLFVGANYSKKLYDWKIGGTKGVGSLSSPTLKITNMVDSFLLTFLNDLRPFKINLPYLRFHISYDLAKILAEDKVYPITKREVNILNLHIKAIDKISLLFKEPNYFQKTIRDYALLGQAIFKEFCIIQRSPILVVLNKKSQMNFFEQMELFNQIRKITNVNIKENFAPEEFEFEDQDHDFDDDSNINQDFFD